MSDLTILHEKATVKKIPQEDNYEDDLMFAGKLLQIY